MTRRWSSGARPGKPAAAAPGEDSNGTIGEYCSGTDTPKLEWNLNTIIQIVTLVGMVGGGIAIWVDKSRDIEDLQGWRTNHEQLHKERLVDVKANEARNDEKFKSVEADVRKLTSLTDSLNFRLTTNENATTGIASTVKDIQA